MVRKEMRSETENLVCYLICLFSLIYLVVHVVYGFAREDSGFRNPEQIFLQTQYRAIDYEPAEEDGLYDGLTLSIPEG